MSHPDEHPLAEPRSNDDLILRLQRLEQKNEQGRSRLEIWSANAAAWSQVLMLLVVIFGYLYTVVPVIQHEALQEKAAKLEIDNAEANNRLINTSKKQKELERRTEQLEADNKIARSELEKILDARSALIANLSAADSKLAIARAKLNEAGHRLSTAVAQREELQLQLDDARNEIEASFNAFNQVRNSLELLKMENSAREFRRKLEDSTNK
jgi:DNA repair exonuclease SbcCD ATPase subunit